MPEKLFEHIPHSHIPVNVNAIHEAEHQAAGFNTRLAVILTKAVGTMWMAYVFTVLAVIGLLGLLGWLSPFTFSAGYLGLSTISATGISPDSECRAKRAEQAQ